MHLAVESAQRAVAVEDRRGVVVDAGRPLFEQRRDQDHPVVSRCCRQSFGRRTRNRFGQIEQRMILALAEILRLKKFRQADDLRAAPGSVGYAAEGLLKILFRLWAARHLHQRHAKFLRGHAFPTSANKYSRESCQLSAVSFQQNPSPVLLHGWYFIEGSFG